MRKALIIAAREYNAAVRTKAFLLSLVAMPIMMGGSIAVQAIFHKAPATEEKRYAVLDLSPGNKIFPVIRQAIEKANATEGGAPLRVEEERAQDTSPAAVDDLRVRLSDRVRKGELVGFLEVPATVFQVPSGRGAELCSLPYRTNRGIDRTFVDIIRDPVMDAVHIERARQRNVGEDIARGIAAPVVFPTPGLVSRAKDTGEIQKEAGGFEAGIFVPLIVMMLLFMIVLMTTTPLMQAVLEEKMQRIAEVLLGSVRPFPLMLGKLLGMTAVALTISAVYLSGGWWAAHHFNYTAYVPATLVVWFIIYQSLASLMFGSLFIAVGAACTDAKETQSLLLPLMIVICLPMFMLLPVIQEPNGSLVTGMSFFPLATPTLMLGRMAASSNVPWWQPFAGVALVLVTTVLCVWVAGRVFRVGILMQGKGARLADLARWVLRG
jgi:ABC-2 type transport system permease protein